MRVLAKKYSKELKEAVMRRMLPPENASVSYLEKETGISRMTLYGWRDEALGRVRRPVKESSSEDRSSREKFLVVWETYALNEAQLGEYCRTKGLYVEEVLSWRNACEEANGGTSVRIRELRSQLGDQSRAFRVLEQELQRKEKALAETAALLVLRKKAEAIWGGLEAE